MANCYTIENFYELRPGELTEEQKREELNDFKEDNLYELMRGLRRGTR